MIRGFSFLLTLLMVFNPALAQARDKFLNIQTVTSPGGISAWLVEDHKLPIIAMSFGWQGAGAANDPAGKSGLTRLLSNTLDEGAGPYDAQAFQAELLNNAISLSFNMGRDDFTGSLKTQTGDKTKAFDLLRLAITQPQFEPDAVKRMIDGNLTRIRSDMTDPDWMATRIMNDRAFAGHPYAANVGGTLSSLPKLSADDLRALHGKILARNNLKIGVMGDISAAELAPLLDHIFGGLPETAQTVVVTDLDIQHQGQSFVYKHDIPQTIIAMMMPGIKRTDPDYEAAVVMDQILGGGGFGSRLMDVIREKAGLTYGIYSDLTELDHTAMFGITTSTKNETLPQMLGLIKTELTRAATTGMTATEMNAAKGYLLGSMPTALTSTDRIAGILLSQQLDNRPIDDLDMYRQRLAAVTLNDVNRVAKKLLSPDKMITVLVGNPATLPEDATPVSTLPNVE